MHFHPARWLLLCACVTARADLSAQEAAAVPAAPASERRSLFTDAELDRFHAISVEREAQRETYIVPPGDDDVVMLEPYIVEGDNSLMLARVRRIVEVGSEAERRRFADLSAGTRHDLLESRRDADRFFDETHQPGAPADREPISPDLIGMSIGIVWALTHGSSVADLFRRPTGVPGE